ncbi:TlpA family protein disulfide reductase [Portibacter lacus]|uniref:Thioredoxin domain-containing protein n=1 Tax=Portibacter lacus TaxID=1099794 RepID=A0AA37SN54_9BACT|nr:redoxin family protein [Portibacter lacus]GLR16237.1 hypothetical protein GCM10007940_08520 [Portibacter lacus]
MFKIIIGILVVGSMIAAGNMYSNKADDVEFVTSTDSLGQFVENLDFGATLYNGTHEDIVELLDALKSKYQGKAVILDLWGTFCGPCLSDFKNSPAKKKELLEMDVHVVYLCAGMSSNANEWKKIIKRDKLVGDHIYLDRRLSMAYREHFGIRNYPNYILLDTKGEFKQNIISAVGDISIERFKEHI